MNYKSKRRLETIERLGGIKCVGLSFIGGPDCPVPPLKLLIQDINVAHTTPKGQAKGNQNVTLLCALCNQRMRVFAHEFEKRILPKRIVAMYLKGWTLEELAEEFDCSYPTVSNRLKELGMQMRKGSNYGGSRAWIKRGAQLLRERQKRFCTAERVEAAKLINKMYDDGDSLREIAQELGISKNTVRSLLGYVS